MSSRIKSSLIYFLLCLTPLVLLIGANYWHETSSVNSRLETEAQTSLNSLSGELDHRLGETEINLTRLATSAPVREFLTQKSSSVLATEKSDADPRSDFGLPHELFVELNSTLRGPGHIANLSLFGPHRTPLFQLERQQTGTDRDRLVFHRNAFPTPSADVGFGQTVTLVKPGSVLQYLVPIDERGVDAGLLVADVKHDEVIGEISGFMEAKNTANQSRSMLVTVIDDSARIIYHPDPALRNQLVSSAFPELLPIAESTGPNGSGVQRFRTADGVEYVSAFAPLPRWHIHLAVARNASALLSPSRWWTIVSFLVATLIAAGAALILGRQGQKRSRGIERVTEDLSAIVKGELDRRIEVKSSDDARGIADRINVVTERLRAQIAREEESRQFESFLRLSAMLTHDLKNAIEALSLIVGNMERHFDNELFRADAMKSLTGATDKLKGIVARLNRPLTSLSGEHKLPATVDLVPILNRVVAMTAEPMREKHNIVLKLPQNLYALVDAASIEEVMENLVLNALEAMQAKGGTLTIEAGQTPSGAAMFSVRDTGPGMSQTFVANRLFRPFATTKKSGIGLGLYTCREAVQANAGSIEVQTAEGAGTTFRVVLPSALIEKRN